MNSKPTCCSWNTKQSGQEASSGDSYSCDLEVNCGNPLRYLAAIQAWGSCPSEVIRQGAFVIWLRRKFNNERGSRGKANLADAFSRASGMIDRFPVLITSTAFSLVQATLGYSDLTSLAGVDRRLLLLRLDCRT